MTRKATKEELQDWQAHWAKLNAVTHAERAALTDEDRLRQTVQLMDFGREMGMVRPSPNTITPVRARWLQLKRLSGDTGGR